MTQLGSVYVTTINDLEVKNWSGLFLNIFWSSMSQLNQTFSKNWPSGPKSAVDWHLLGFQAETKVPKCQSSYGFLSFNQNPREASSRSRILLISLVYVYMCVFMGLFIYVFMCVTPPGQTKNDTDLKFGTHTHIFSIKLPWRPPASKNWRVPWVFRITLWLLYFLVVSIYFSTKKQWNSTQLYMLLETTLFVAIHYRLYWIDQDHTWDHTSHTSIQIIDVKLSFVLQF